MPNQPYAKGVTLTETLITLAIVGLVLIPTLLTSSAYFSSRIIKVREQLGLSHDVSLMLQQLSTELAQSPKLLPSTTADTFTPATELRYSYRDPIRNEQRYGGLRLIDTGGRRQVQALTYNGTAWEAYSPFRSHPSTAFTLATTAVFDYCNDTVCSLTPDQATYVKISGWTFRNEANLAQTLPLAELRLVVGSQLPEAEGQLATDKPLLLYTINATQSMGGGAINGKSLHFYPRKQTLVSLPSDLTTDSSTSGLSSILANVGGSGVQAVAVDEQRGHFFFCNSEKLYFWKQGMASASTLFDTYSPGQAMFVSPNTGILYFGHQTSNNRPLRYFDPNTSTLGTVTTMGNTRDINAYGAYEYDTIRGLLYFSSSYATPAIRMYKEATGEMTTVMSTASGFYWDVLKHNPTTGALFIGRGGSGTEANQKHLNLWIPNASGTGGSLTTIASGLNRAGSGGALFPIPSANNKLIFGDRNGLYYWQEGQAGISTIVYEVDSRPAYFDKSNRPRTPSSIKQTIKGAVLDTDNSVFYFYTSGTYSGTYAYNYSNHTLTTLTPTGLNYGKDSLTLDLINNKLYIGNTSTVNKAIFQWDANANTLTTLITNISKGEALRVTHSPRALIVGAAENNDLSVFNFTSNTIITIPVFGSNIAKDNFFDEATQQIFFAASYGDSAMGSNGYYSYSPQTGLHTLVEPNSFAINTPFYDYSTGIDTNHKLIFLGSSFGSRPVYVLNYSQANPATVGGNIKLYRATATGAPQAHGLINIANGKTYAAMATDADNTLYLLNTTDGTLQHYTYYTPTKTHNLTGSGTLNASYYTASSALALDEASTAIWLLQPTSKTLYQFANRKATGALTPAVTVSVNQNTTPTGIAMDQRNGHLYVIDSNKTGNNITLRHYNAAGAYLGASHDVAIDVSATGLGAGNAATTETAFRIEIDEIGNILYLIAPSLGKVYALSMPLFKDS